MLWTLLRCFALTVCLLPLSVVCVQISALEGDTHGVLRMLRAALKDDIANVRAMFKAFDTNKSYAIGSNEFVHGLEQLGLEESREVAQALFDELDDDGSYHVSFHEFKAWLYKHDDMDAEFERRLRD